jgi:hypothetical protein
LQRGTFRKERCEERFIGEEGFHADQQELARAFERRTDVCFLLEESTN